MSIDEYERHRLQGLSTDQSPDTSYDSIAAILAEICQVPTALISLLGEKRQWVNPNRGLYVSDTPRDISFCQHVIECKELLIVSDTHKDERFIDDPLVVGHPHIRFFAGAPIVTRAGYVLGALCVIDRTPRQLSEGQLKALSDLSSQVVLQIELRNHLKQERDTQAQIKLQKQELEMLNEEVCKLADAAIALTRTKSEFLATVSHEIRTPLNSIIGLSELLLLEDLRPTVVERISTIHKSGITLLEVINDILDLSKINAGKMSVEEVAFDLNSLLREVADLLRPRIEEKGVKLVIAALPPSLGRVRGDMHKIRQILLNFMSNATKFTEQGHIGITGTVTSESDAFASITIAVSDTGVGIAQTHLNAVFDNFTQADNSTTRKYGGTGLGLAICRQLAKLMGGQVGVVSKEGEGSTFWLELKLKKEVGEVAPVPTTIQTHVAQDLSGLSILLVEDNAVNRTVAEGFLKVWKCRYKLAGTGVEALDMAAQEAFDIILMDIEMPEMDGYEATREIRKREGNTDRHTPIVAMTAHALEGSRETCLRAGMDDFISKPLRGARFRELLERWAGQVLRETT